MKVAGYYIAVVSVIAAVRVPVVLATSALEPIPLLNSDKSVTVFPAASNVQCNDYSSKARKMATDALAASGTLTGPDSPLDDDESGETATYSATLTNGKVTRLTSVTSTAPINYLLLKGFGEVRVYVYKTGGEITDGNLALASDGPIRGIRADGPIRAINLCYGIPAAAPTRAIPNCEEKGTIDQTSVGCPTDGSQTLVCNLELKDALGDPTKNFGLDNEDCCTCNLPAEVQFTECDPNIDPPTPGACPVAPVVNTQCDPDIGCPVGVVVEPPSIIEAVRDPDTCIYKTIVGRRRFFCESSFTPPPPAGRVPVCVLRTILGKRVLLCSPSRR